jgi:starch-binding outer membrane protein, SusD/RagB family
MRYKILITGAVTFILLITSCKKENLQLTNPNQPTPVLSLKTESGITNFALGIINRQLGNVVNAGVTNLKVVADIHQSIMGDEQFSPYGNFGMRWSNQVYKITLPTGTVVTNPFGVAQKESIQGFNSRQAGDRNVFQYEWTFCYFYISQSNILLQALENPDLVFSGDGATKKALLKAWALWWKGYAYSRIGSMYVAGVINDKTDGTTNGSYVTSQVIITEANKNLDAAATALTGIAVSTDYTTLFSAITPSYNAPADVVTPDMWKRQINTMKARNLLMNKKITAMTPADWTQITTLANNGVQQSDKIFRQGLTGDGNNDVANPGLPSSFFHPYILTGTGVEWLFASERLIQEFKTGDNRLNRNFYINPAPYPANIRSRGLQFGTRWAVKNVEDGGTFATNQNKGLISVAGTYEETLLMSAEALIRTGQTEQGLQIIDEVRSYQNAGIAAVAGTGLTQAQAIEELRRERRVALFMRGLAFYDARRWGVTAPVAQGGGRGNALVYLPASLVGGANDDVRNCFMEYNYMDYFDVPLTEVDFNVPAAGSAPVKN